MTTLYHAEILHLAQFTLSAFGAYNSWIAITNLRQYEQQSEKAAKFSTTAANQLHRTRTTQASGLVAVLASMGASLFLATSWQKIPHAYRLLASPAMVVVTLIVRGHVNNFWTEKAKVPMVTGYNEAISKTKVLLATLQYLEYSWLLSSVFAGVMAYR